MGARVGVWHPNCSEGLILSFRRGVGGWRGTDRTKCYKEKESSSHEDLSLINNFINRGLLVPRSSDNIFVIHRDVTAKHRWGFFGLGKKHINTNVKYGKKNPWKLRSRITGFQGKTSVKCSNIIQIGAPSKEGCASALQGLLTREATGSCTGDIRWQASQCHLWHRCWWSQAPFQSLQSREWRTALLVKSHHPQSDGWI